MAQTRVIDWLVAGARLADDEAAGPPAGWRFLLAFVVSVAGSIALSAAVAAGCHALYPGTRNYPHLLLDDYGTLAGLGAAAAAASWIVVTRYAGAPRWLFFRMAIAVVVLSFLPDCYLFAKGQPSHAVWALMAMHLAVALVTYNALVRIAPPVGRQLRPREPQLTGDGEEEEIGLARVSTVLAAMIGCEIALGVVALLFVRGGRPNGWLPRTGEVFYLAHGALGFPLGIGAIAMFFRARLSTNKTYKAVAWLGTTGVLLASIGGLLTTLHPVRIFGMALMIFGGLAGATGYLLPLLDKLPQGTPSIYSEDDGV